MYRWSTAIRGVLEPVGSYGDGSYGLMIVTPVGLKSATLRVITVMPCTSAVAAMSASRSPRSSGTCSRAQHGPLGSVFVFNRQNAEFQFHDGDGRYEEVGGIDAFRPCHHIPIGLAKPYLAQLGQHVGIEHI